MRIYAENLQYLCIASVAYLDQVQLPHVATRPAREERFIRLTYGV